MSGGYFDYDQYILNDITAKIAELIGSNDDTTKNAYGDNVGYNFPHDVVIAMEVAVELLEQSAILVQRIDWLVSGDDDVDSFRRRLREQAGDVSGGRELMSRIIKSGVSV